MELEQDNEAGQYAPWNLLWFIVGLIVLLAILRAFGLI